MTSFTLCYRRVYLFLVSCKYHCCSALLSTLLRLVETLHQLRTVLHLSKQYIKGKSALFQGCNLGCLYTQYDLEFCEVKLLKIFIRTFQVKNVDFFSTQTLFSTIFQNHYSSKNLLSGHIIIFTIFIRLLQSTFEFSKSLV